MTAYETSRSTTQTLTGTAADTITLTQRWGAVRITNLHASNTLWVTPNDVVAVAAADGTIPVPANSSRVIDAAHVAGARTMIVGVVGDGNQYTVEGMFGSQAEVLSALADEVAEGLDNATSPLLSVVGYKAPLDAEYATTSASFVDVDATNLVLPDFTVPASGRVLVKMSSLGQASGGTMRWNLRQGEADVADSVNIVLVGSLNIRCNYEAVISGLTPGATVSGWKMGFRSNGTATVAIQHGGQSRGQVVMEVWSA